MHMLVAFVALPAVALLLALASRLEDGLRGEAPVRPPRAPDPLAVPASVDLTAAEPEPSGVSRGR